MSTLKEVDQDFNKLKQTLKDAPKDAFFFCPIVVQYKQYTTILKGNLIIIEPNFKIIIFCRGFNSTTEKINGIFKRGESTEILKTLLGLLTFNS